MSLPTLPPPGLQSTAALSPSLHPRGRRQLPCKEYSELWRWMACGRLRSKRATQQKNEGVHYPREETK